MSATDEAHARWLASANRYRTKADDGLVARIETVLGPTLTWVKLQWRQACQEWGVQSPGALGWLLAMVREAWGDPSIHVLSDGITWQPANGNLDDIDVGYQDTEQGALVALLEAAPQPTKVMP